MFFSFWLFALSFFGVNSITAWLTQASDGAKSGRRKTVSVTDKVHKSVSYKSAGRECLVLLLPGLFALPDGVIGNTWAFGAHVPGSSPGRVGLRSKK